MGVAERGRLRRRCDPARSGFGSGLKRVRGGRRGRFCPFLSLDYVAVPRPNDGSILPHSGRNHSWGGSVSSDVLPLHLIGPFDTVFASCQSPVVGFEPRRKGTQANLLRLPERGHNFQNPAGIRFFETLVFFFTGGSSGAQICPPDPEPSKQPPRLSPNETAPNSLTDKPTVRLHCSHCSADWSPGRSKGLCRIRNWAIARPSPGLLALPRGSSASLDLRISDAVWRGQQHCQADSRNRRQRLDELQIAAYTRGSLARIADDGRIQEPGAIGG